MNRRLAVLLLLLLGSLSLSANVSIEPNRRYDVVFTTDKPGTVSDENWQGTYTGMTMVKARDVTVEIKGHRIYKTEKSVLGTYVLKQIDKKFEVLGGTAQWKLGQATLLPLTPEEQELENIKKQRAEEDKARARKKLADENDPRRTVDAKGKPVHNAGSPEAEAQMRESARQQDKSAANFKQYNQGGTNGPVTGEGLLGKPVYNAGSPEAEAQMRQSAQEQDEAVDRFKKSGAPGNGPVSGEGLLGKPVKNTGTFSEDDDFAAGAAGKSKSAAQPADFPDEEEDKRPLSQRIMNTGKQAPPAAAVAPAAQADAANERPLAASGSKFSKPKTGQGTKKDDTLFKNQNQNTPPKD